jgi:hypothetical protein
MGYGEEWMEWTPLISPHHPTSSSHPTHFYYNIFDQWGGMEGSKSEELALNL